MKLYKAVELKDGEYVQFVGVYVLNWRQEWGKPTIGFVEVDDNDTKKCNDDIKESEE